jgi:Protein of unknown function (DUF4058)
MPIHDWTRVNAGIFHYFHQRWIGAICDALNEGLLPDEYYALAEQRTGERIPDVLTLIGKADANEAVGDRSPRPSTAVRERPTTKFVVETDAEIYLRKKNVVVVRHVSDDRIVALIEIVSPGNKSGAFAFRDFLDKVFELLRARVHLLLIDLLPRTKRDPRGNHAAVWEAIVDERVSAPKKEPLTLVAYEAGDATRGHYEPVAVGRPLPDMPLFLEYGWHVMVPLEATYMTAFRTVPVRWRRVIDSSTR